jgi:ubiquinone/menaquinone biosynthesis C-methylase UbiE
LSYRGYARCTGFGKDAPFFEEGFMSNSFSDHFSSFASRYADFRPHYPNALFDYLASLAPPDSTVWDCAAGNGQASVDLAARFEKVIATDASRQQIESAQKQANVEYRVAPAEASGLSDQSVALITVAQALHWFQLDRFYAEARRVLRPQGVLAVWAYGINELEDDTLNQAVQNYYANVVGPFWPPERKIVEEGYRNIPFPFKEMEPPPIRMEARWTLEQLLGYFSTWSATNRFIKANGTNPLEPLSEELKRHWDDPKEPRLVTWPLSIRVGRN